MARIAKLTSFVVLVSVINIITILAVVNPVRSTARLQLGTSRERKTRPPPRPVRDGIRGFSKKRATESLRARFTCRFEQLQTVQDGRCEKWPESELKTCR